MKTFILAIAIGLIGAASAQAETYLCSIKEMGNSGWIRPEITFSHDKGAKLAVVMDAVVKSRYGKPVTAKVIADNAKRMTVRWEIKAARDKGRQHSNALVYKLSYFKADGRALVSMTPTGYGNSFQGNGSCKTTR